MTIHGPDRQRIFTFTQQQCTEKKKKFIAFLKHFVVKTIPIHMDLHIFAHYMETIVVLFLKLCTLKPIFKRLRFQDRLHFQDLKMLLPCK